MSSFSGKKIRNDRIRTEGEVAFQKIWKSWNFRNSKWKFEIPALLQGGTLCLVFLVKTIQND